MKINKIKVSLIVLFLITIIGYLIFDYINHLPKKVISYESINLSDSKDDVYYKLGVPKTVYLPPEYDEKYKGYFQYSVKQEDIDKKENGVKDFNSWRYEYPEHRIWIDFDSKNKVKEITCIVDIDKFYTNEICQINGIQMLDTEKMVIKRFGTPDKTQIDNLIKTMEYKKYGMEFTLEKEKVYVIKVKDE